MNKHIYTIGTERPLIEPFFLSCVDEAKHIQNTTNEETIVVIVDDGSARVEKINNQIAESNGDKELRVICFNKQMQQALFTHLRKNLSDASVVDLLDFEGYSYGRVMNKQFLAAGVVNASHLHRRDSDVKIDIDNFGYPSDVENKYLGKTIEILQENRIQGIDTFDKEQCVYMVGSGYSGNSDWKVDFGIFLEEDKDLIPEVTGLFGYDEELSNEYMNEILTGNVKVEHKEIFLPERNHPNPLCGNLSMYKIFRYLPCSTICNTIGSDNLIRGFLKRLHAPIVYHDKFVYHEFTPDRDNSNMTYLKSYWPRVINKLIYYKLIETLIYDYSRLKVPRLIRIEDIDFKHLIHMDAFSFGLTIDTVKEALTAFSDIMNRAQNTKLAELGKYIGSTAFYEETCRNIYYGMKNHEKLLNNWEEIMSICSSYKL